LCSVLYFDLTHDDLFLVNFQWEDQTTARAFEVLLQLKLQVESQTSQSLNESLIFQAYQQFWLKAMVTSSYYAQFNWPFFKWSSQISTQQKRLINIEYQPETRIINETTNNSNSTGN
jgi:hypothetical protein